MLSKKMNEAINAQINAEMWSAHLYLSMSNWCLKEGHEGFAHWFRIQHREEQDHAEILSQYVIRRGGNVTLQAIERVPTEWEDLQTVVEATLRHEENVTQMINNLVRTAIRENDFASQSRLQWFVDEQVEEEDSVRQLLTKLQHNSCNKQACSCGIYTVDKELMEREYHCPEA